MLAFTHTYIYMLTLQIRGGRPSYFRKSLVTVQKLGRMSVYKCFCTVSKTCSKTSRGFGWVSRSTLKRHAEAELARVLDKHRYPGHIGPPAYNDPVDMDRGSDVAHVDEDVPVPDPQPLNDEPVLEPEPTLDISTWDELQAWEEPLLRVDHAEGEETPPVLLGELLLTYFEWMCVHKPTNECAKAVHI